MKQPPAASHLEAIEQFQSTIGAPHAGRIDEALVALVHVLARHAAREIVERGSPSDDPNAQRSS